MGFFNKIQKQKQKEAKSRVELGVDEFQAVVDKHKFNTYEVMDILTTLQNGTNIDTASKMQTMSSQNKAMRQTLIDNGLLKIDDNKTEQ